MGEMADYALEQVEHHEEQRSLFRSGLITIDEAYDAGVIDELGHELQSGPMNTHEEPKDLEIASDLASEHSLESQSVLRQVGTLAAAATLTPQQARVGEVSEALLGAYGRASTLELTEAEADGLMEPFDDSQVEIRPHDGLIYIPHIHVSTRLNRVFRPGQWSLVCRRHWLEGGTLYAEYVLLIRGCFVGESVGGHQYQPNNPKTNYSDSLESTAAEALRRICGKRLGCGSQVWEPEYAREWVAKYGVQERGKWAKRPTANPSPQGVSTEGPAIKTPPRPSVTTAKATHRATPKAKPDPLAAFQERCKAKLVAKAKSDPGLLPYWQRYAVEKGWILPNEGIEAILGNITPVFQLEPDKDAAGNAANVAGQFAAFENDIHLAAHLEQTAAAQDEQDNEVEIAGHKDASAAGCPNCDRKTVILSRDFEGILYCQTCAWQWDIQSGDYYEEHDWQKVVCPIPPKGMKKAEYDKQPMTLGQISRLDPKRFFGIVANNQQAKSWVGRDGKSHPPSKQDEEFAMACREAWAHMESSKADTGDTDPETDYPN
jgi:ribosomal protein L37AE/L43A